MTEVTGTGGGQGRGRRRRRSRSNRSGQFGGQGHRPAQDGQAAAPQRPQGQGPRRPRKQHRHNSNGNHQPTTGALRHFTGELNEFELFCAFHLGIDEDGYYRPSDLSSLARRFEVDEPAVHKALAEFRMEPDRVKRAGLDMSLYRLDMEVAPPGVDRVELARSIFQEVLDAGCGVGPVPERLPLPAEMAPLSAQPEPDAE